MRVLNWFRENYSIRQDAHVRLMSILPGILALNLGLAFTQGENWTAFLYVLFIVYLLIGVDAIVYHVHKYQDRKIEREAEQLLRAEGFEDRLDKSFGLDK